MHQAAVHIWANQWILRACWLAGFCVRVGFTTQKANFSTHRERSTQRACPRGAVGRGRVRQVSEFPPEAEAPPSCAWQALQVSVWSTHTLSVNSNSAFHFSCLLLDVLLCCCCCFLFPVQQSTFCCPRNDEVNAVCLLHSAKSNWC